MNIHEYQAKSLLTKFGVAVPRGFVSYTPEEAARHGAQCFAFLGNGVPCAC